MLKRPAYWLWRISLLDLLTLSEQDYFKGKNRHIYGGSTERRCTMNTYVHGRKALHLFTSWRLS